MVNEFGRADILVNAAGFTRLIQHSERDALEDDLIDAILTSNARGPFSMIRAFVPLLRQSGDVVVVNISSIAASYGAGSNIIYGASKDALDTMSMALARRARPGDPRRLRLPRGGQYRLRAGARSDPGQVRRKGR
jgi:3-oxoacyl-[acyl-carrier protein] reductase